jgi:hypothetical protein
MVIINSAPETLVKHTKKRNKDKINVGKITFYTFKVLNAQVPRQNFPFLPTLILSFIPFFSMLNNCPGGTI